MGKSSKYNHYMQRIDINGQNVIDVEEKFPGVLYMKAEGINTIGKSKNIYTEEYADSDRKRVYLPNDDEYANESTVIKMTFLIIGPEEQRINTLNAFLEYLRKGIHRYWDNARNREFEFIITDEISVSDEQWHGTQPYIELTIPMQNLNGKTRVHTD